MQAFSLGAQELQLQAWGSTAGRLYSVGLDLAAIDTRIVVKLPITDAGVEAAGLLRSQGVRVTLTGASCCPHEHAALDHLFGSFKSVTAQTINNKSKSVLTQACTQHIRRSLQWPLRQTTRRRISAG